ARSTRDYLYFAQVGFVVALIWGLRNTAPRAGRFLLWALAIAHVAAMIYCGGAGAAVNHFYDAMIATAMIVALALPGFERLVEGVRFPRIAHAVLLIVPFFLTSILLVPQ